MCCRGYMCVMFHSHTCSFSNCWCWRLRSDCSLHSISVISVLIYLPYSHPVFQCQATLNKMRYFCNYRLQNYCAVAVQCTVDICTCVMFTCIVYAYTHCTWTLNVLVYFTFSATLSRLLNCVHCHTCTVLTCSVSGKFH